MLNKKVFLARCEHALNSAKRARTAALRALENCRLASSRGSGLNTYYGNNVLRDQTVINKPRQDGKSDSSIRQTNQASKQVYILTVGKR
jgi:hypothetical protein